MFLNRPLSEHFEKDTTTFLVKGMVIGQTSISALVTDKNGRTITSAPQQIEVNPLDFFKDFIPLLSFLIKCIVDTF